jgi:hypothetical protein
MRSRVPRPEVSGNTTDRATLLAQQIALAAIDGGA